MIVCVCNNISDREIRAAADQGMRTVGELRRDLGVGTCCGKCVSCARQVLHEHLANKAVPFQSTELRRGVAAPA